MTLFEKCLSIKNGFDIVWPQKKHRTITKHLNFTVRSNFFNFCLTGVAYIMIDSVEWTRHPNYGDSKRKGCEVKEKAKISID